MKKVLGFLGSIAVIGAGVAGGLFLYNKFKGDVDEYDDEFDDDFDDDFSDDDDDYVDITPAEEKVAEEPVATATTTADETVADVKDADEE